MSISVSGQNLWFSYNGKPLLKGVHFALPRGGLLIVCGMSGNGKSTLLRLIMGLERPTMGSVRLFGRDTGTLTEFEFNALRAKVGFVFQNSALISTQTVEENLRLPLVYHGLARGAEIEKRVEKTLEMLLIKEYRGHYPAELSLGLQKRTAMARAIITRPELILMDEPTSGLDTISRSLMLALIENIRLVNKVGMIIVTNDILAVRNMDADIGILKEGEMLEPMAYSQLKHSPDSTVQALLEEIAA